MPKNKFSGSTTKFSNGQQALTPSQYLNGRFIGDGITLKMGTKDYALTIWDTLFKKNNQTPDRPLPSRKVDLSWFKRNENRKLNSTWLGHSSLMIHAGGYLILTDPVFEDRITPMKLARFHKEIPVNVGEISDVDVVIISHDNFDHLNKYSIMILAPVTKKFLVPLGVGTYLLKWGVDPKRIIELDWWHQYQFDSNLTFTATPARHFSGRGLFTRNRTLWNSWVISSSEFNLFFSGDSGYFYGFKEIGNSFGPFDLTYMQCGAYYRAWRQIQMNPEETIKAHLDLRGKILHPIHWGTFNMSFHAWYDPIQRLVKEAKRHQVAMATPIAGETIAPSEGKLGSNWWEPIINP